MEKGQVRNAAREPPWPSKVKAALRGVLTVGSQTLTGASRAFSGAHCVTDVNCLATLVLTDPGMEGCAHNTPPGPRHVWPVMLFDDVDRMPLLDEHGCDGWDVVVGLDVAADLAQQPFCCGAPPLC